VNSAIPNNQSFYHRHHSPSPTVTGVLNSHHQLSSYKVNHQQPSIEVKDEEISQNKNDSMPILFHPSVEKIVKKLTVKRIGMR
jgi:hypothetical protein